MDRSWFFVHGPGRYDDMHANLISCGFLKGAAVLALLGCELRIASWVLGKTPAIITPGPRERERASRAVAVVWAAAGLGAAGWRTYV